MKNDSTHSANTAKLISWLVIGGFAVESISQVVFVIVILAFHRPSEPLLLAWILMLLHIGFAALILWCGTTGLKDPATNLKSCNIRTRSAFLLTLKRLTFFMAGLLILEVGTRFVLVLLAGINVSDLSIMKMYLLFAAAVIYTIASHNVAILISYQAHAVQDSSASVAMRMDL